MSTTYHPYFRKFSLDELGVDTNAFLRHVRPVYESLEWDMYDTKRAALALPTRRRALANTMLELRNGTWNVARIPTLPYVQPNHGTYDRVQPRVYPDVSIDVVEQREVAEYQRAVARIIHEQTGATRLGLILTFLRAVDEEGRTGQCALEGAPHQDGADYIVSALVVNRVNLRFDSGQSSVHALDGTPLLETVLQPGEGILQDDVNLRHHITDIRRQIDAQPGFRDIFGLDISLLS